VVPAAAFTLALLVGAVALGGVPPGELPGIGSTITRTQAIFNGSADASEANVAFRIELWKYSLRTAVSEGPLLGSGFGRPFALEFRGADLGTEDTGGAHNSFVGIAYYMGFPALAMFLAMIVLAVRRVGKKQLTSVIQPAQAAWLVAGLVTMFTNVALEAPYIGGPFWLLLGWCVLTEPIDAVVLGPADAGRQD
jgi:O-antigen ligase